MIPLFVAGLKSQIENNYHADAVRFDGSVWFINNALASSDNGTASFFFWRKVASIPPVGNAVYWAIDPADTYTSDVQDSPIGLGENTYFGIDGDSNNFVYTDYWTLALGVWQSVLCSVDVRRSPPVLVVYQSDVAVGTSLTTGGTITGSSSILFNSLPFWVGSDGQGPLVGDMADLWIAPGVSLLDIGGDIPAATRRNFTTVGGKPINPSVYKGLYGGAVLLSGNASTFGTNQGTGGPFIMTGALTNASTSPSD